MVSQLQSRFAASRVDVERNCNIFWVWSVDATMGHIYSTEVTRHIARCASNIDESNSRWPASKIASVSIFDNPVAQVYTSLTRMCCRHRAKHIPCDAVQTESYEF